MHARIFFSGKFLSLENGGKQNGGNVRTLKEKSESKHLPKPTKRRNESTLVQGYMSIFLQNFSSSCVVKIDH